MPYFPLRSSGTRDLVALGGPNCPITRLLARHSRQALQNRESRPASTPCMYHCQQSLFQLYPTTTDRSARGVRYIPLKGEISSHCIFRKSFMLQFPDGRKYYALHSHPTRVVVHNLALRPVPPKNNCQLCDYVFDETVFFTGPATMHPSVFLSKNYRSR